MSISNDSVPFRVAVYTVGKGKMYIIVPIRKSEKLLYQLTEKWYSEQKGKGKEAYWIKYRD